MCDAVLGVREAGKQTACADKGRAGESLESKAKRGSVTVRICAFFAGL